MGVCGYLSRRELEFRMRGGADGCGIQWQGPVVEGRQGLLRRMYEQRAAVEGQNGVVARTLEGVGSGGQREAVREPWE